MSNAASNLVARVMLALSAAGATVWRNNVGLGWAGKHVSTDNRTGLTVLANARPVKFGLAKGSGDLIGFAPVTITPDMVGQTLPVFGSWEVKSGTGRPSKDQTNFRAFVVDAGGIGAVVHSPEEAVQSLKLRGE